MKADATGTYLHDHLAGAAFAIELLESLREAQPEKPLGLFASELLDEIKSDSAVLERLAQRFDGEAHGMKQAAGWIAEKATRVKLHGHGPLGTFEMLEALALGILGKEALWNALAIAAKDDQRLQGLDYDALVARARALPGMSGQDLVTGLGPAEPVEFDEPDGEGPYPDPVRHVVAYDLGMKKNILRELRRSGCRVTVVGPRATADEVVALRPDGVFVSNGPGDPAAVPAIAEELRRLVERKPLFGICLGHQILALALGGRTYKLKFGHRGVNQPVKDLATGRVEITTHNHGFAVDPASLPDDVSVTHLNLNDRTCEGLAHRRLPVFSVQYHPEAAAGPHDAKYLFDRFMRVMGK